mmetsp:Transcript_80642/g.160203  ORF Transcript_80642/g.160203 Transcript_80642/m.160203 type:complete len:81 (+) Transcript_80642:1222-1464(+)
MPNELPILVFVDGGLPPLGHGKVAEDLAVALQLPKVVGVHLPSLGPSSVSSVCLTLLSSRGRWRMCRLPTLGIPTVCVPP